MREEKFISELYLRLLWKCSKRERLEILHDMKEYFEIALSSGKTEKEICDELGSPKDVIRRIEKEEKQQEPNDTYTLEWLGRSIAAFAAVAILGFLITQLGHINFVILSLLMPVEGCLIWYIFGGKYFSSAWLMEKQETELKKILVLHIVYFIISISAAFYFINSSFDCEKWMWFVKEPSKYGLCLKNILLTVALLFVVMYVINMASFHKYTIAWYSLAIHAIGSICMIFGFLHMLSRISDPIQIIPMFIKSMLIYAEGVILALGFLYYSHKLIKKEK